MHLTGTFDKLLNAPPKRSLSGSVTTPVKGPDEGGMPKCRFSDRRCKSEAPEGTCQSRSFSLPQPAQPRERAPLVTEVPSEPTASHFEAGASRAWDSDSARGPCHHDLRTGDRDPPALSGPLARAHRVASGATWLLSTAHKA